MGKEKFKLRCAVFLILFKEEKVLLSKRLNTGWMDGYYELVAGHVKEYESISEALMREAKEEIGIDIKQTDLIPATALHRVADGVGKDYVFFFFEAKEWEGEPKNMEPEKCGDLDWFDPDNLPDNTLTHVIQALENYKNNVAFFETKGKVTKD